MVLKVVALAFERLGAGGERFVTPLQQTVNPSLDASRL
jgi:hypothetical protein